MRCPECDHKVPVGKERCLYCGAVLKVASPVPSNGASEAMGQGEDTVRVEEQTHTFTTPQSKTDLTDANTELNFKPPSDTGHEDAPWQFSMAKTGRRKPVGQFTLLIIFLASAALVGLIIFLMG